MIVVQLCEYYSWATIQGYSGNCFPETHHELVYWHFRCFRFLFKVKRTRFLCDNRIYYRRKASFSSMLWYANRRVLIFGLFWRFGNKVPLVFYFLVGGICSIIAGSIPGQSPAQLVAQNAVAFLGRMAFVGSNCVIFVFTSELFPTVIRNNGQSVCGIVLCIGCVIAPLLPLIVRIVTQYTMQNSCDGKNLLSLLCFTVIIRRSGLHCRWCSRNPIVLCNNVLARDQRNDTAGYDRRSRGTRSRCWTIELVGRHAVSETGTPDMACSRSTAENPRKNHGHSAKLSGFPCFIHSRSNAEK